MKVGSVWIWLLCRAADGFSSVRRSSKKLSLGVRQFPTDLRVTNICSHHQPSTFLVCSSDNKSRHPVPGLLLSPLHQDRDVNLYAAWRVYGRTVGGTIWHYDSHHNTINCDAILSVMLWPMGHGMLGPQSPRNGQWSVYTDGKSTQFRDLLIWLCWFVKQILLRGGDFDSPVRVMFSEIPW